MFDAADVHERESRGGFENGAVLLPIVGITVSEALVFVGQFQGALWIHLLTLLLCLFAPIRYPDETSAFQAMALVPLFRLITLGMPVFLGRTLLWLPFIYGPLLVPIVMLYRKSDDLTVRAGWRSATALLPVLVFISVFLAEIEYRIIEPAALIHSWTFGEVLVVAVVMIGFVGLVEELLFRGVLQRTFQQQYGRGIGLVMASLVFAMMHSGYGQAGELGFALGIGLGIGWLYDRTDSLVLVVLVHGIMNVFLFAVIPVHGPLVTP